MFVPLRLAVIVLVAAAGSLSAQQMSSRPAFQPLTASLGPLGTGLLLTGGPVGSIGLVRSDLAQVVSTSPEAVRLARIFERDRLIGRPSVLIGAVAVIGGLAAYASRGGALGIGGREFAAVAVGTGALMYGADRLAASRRALAASLEAFNRDR